MGRAGGALLIDLGYSMVFAVTGYYRDSFSTNLLLRDKHLQEREAAWCVPAAVYLVSTEPFFPFLPSWPGLLKPPPGIRHRSIPGRPTGLHCQWKLASAEVSCLREAKKLLSIKVFRGLESQRQSFLGLKDTISQTTGSEATAAQQ